MQNETTRRAAVRGQWSALRPVVTLGVTQIVGFGTIFYAFGVLVAPLSTDLGLSVPFAYGCLSGALMLGAFCAPLAGRLMDRFGSRTMMAVGSVMVSGSMALIAQSGSAPGLILALCLTEVFAALVLYDAAFASLAEIFGQGRARRAITQMTLMGGFASTVFWPLTFWLELSLGWRGTFWVFSALHLVLCLPLHLSLPRLAQSEAIRNSAMPNAYAPIPSQLHGRTMLLLGFGFSASWAVMSAFSAQWVPIFGALGLNEGLAVAAGALMGPSQVGARILEMLFAQNRHPMITGLVSLGCMVVAMVALGFGPTGFGTAVIFAVLFGIGQGLGTVIRGTVPLALFGSHRYAERLGKLAGARQFAGALSPFALAGALALWGPGPSLTMAGALCIAALIAFHASPWRTQSRVTQPDQA